MSSSLAIHRCDCIPDQYVFLCKIAQSMFFVHTEMRLGVLSREIIHRQSWVQNQPQIDKRKRLAAQCKINTHVDGGT